MLIIIGVVLGIGISVAGSILVSFYPIFPFSLIFLTTVIPSVLCLIILTYHTKPNVTKLISWLSSFIALFAISFLSFAIYDYHKMMSNMAIHSVRSDSTLNWDVIIIYNIYYSLGAALLMSPIGYFAVKWISEYKRKKSE
jgi:hypothetical protein